jgi:hypothetical protein
MLLAPLLLLLTLRLGQNKLPGKRIETGPVQFRKICVTNCSWLSAAAEKADWLHTVFAARERLSGLVPWGRYDTSFTIAGEKRRRRISPTGGKHLGCRGTSGLEVAAAGL